MEVSLRAGKFEQALERARVGASRGNVSCMVYCSQLLARQNAVDEAIGYARTAAAAGNGL